MIFAEKITILRKKNGWSQEELANQIHVSRQSVSKWESAQAVPNLEKILLLSQIYGVSTDYLLKDSLNEEEPISAQEEVPSYRTVSLEEANDYLAVKAKAARSIALAVMLCIISPISLILLSALQEAQVLKISENMAAGIGLCVLILLVACAVAIFILTGEKTKQYDWLEKESFETAYGVDGMVRERKKSISDSHTYGLIAGITLCILSVLPIFAALLLGENDVLMICAVCLLLAIVSIGVMVIIRSDMPWAAMKCLLQEEDYTAAEKKKNAHLDKVASAYWCVIVAGFLAYSFLTNDWKRSWIIFAVGGVFYGAVAALDQAFFHHEGN